MIVNTVIARHEWASRVNEQAEQLRIIAAATDDDGMRDELLGNAQRLGLHAAQIATCSSTQ